MDIRSWKSVILSWVQKCGFVDENVLTLEQSNIYKFFEHYLEYLEYDYKHLALDTTDSTHSDLSSCNDTPLIKFLQTVYPDFGPNLDTSGNLDRSDYFLVYTLMLHYACVIKKSTQYQIKCTELPEHIQKAIASFLSRIVNSHKITRFCLVEALETTKKFFEPAAPPAMVLPYTTSTVRQALMEAAIIPADPEAPGTPVKAITDSPQTPQDTPLHSSRDEYSPLPICSTPMRERERMTVFEWRQVMDKLAATEIKLAELETKLTSAERKLISTENEYSILDELFQEVSKTKVNLQNANKELKAEIEILREKIQIFEETSINEEADEHSNFEHLKQGYVKEIAAKEAIIAEINEHLQDAISAHVKENARLVFMNNTELSEQVREIEEQLKKCFDQINTLNLTVNQNKARLRDKDLEISCLERDKQDLAQCLNVLRQEAQGRREVLNASSDMLDTSLSPGSVPENLGSCVIEKQLREKDQEICQLKEEFAKLQSDIYKLINAEVKVEPSFKDQTQLLKAICDALIVSPQAAAEYETRKLHSEIEILLAKLQSEKDARADMHDPHDKECIKMTCELAFIDEDLDNEKQIVAKQHKRILEAQQRLDSLALTEKYNKQLDELQHQLEILETELSQMALQKLNSQHCVLNYLEDEKASDEMSRQSLEETKRLEQQINSKHDLLEKKESEVAEVKDQIAVLQQQMKDEGAKGRLQAPARMAEIDQLVKDRKVLAITSHEQSQRLAHRHDRLDKLELARKKKEIQIKNENHDPDSEIGRYYARELQELESKCHFTLQKCVQAKAEAAEQADKLSHVLQRLEQIQYQNERSIEVATTKEEPAAQKDSDRDLIAEKDAKIAELSVEMMVLTDKLDSLADDRARLKASAKEHRKNASILQKSLDLLSAERSGLAKKLGLQKSLLKMYGKSIEVLLEKQNSQKDNEKCYEQKLKKLQEEHSDVIKKLELGIDQWRERYENLENDISAQKEIASTNERKHQDRPSTVQAHAGTISKLRDDYNTLEKDLLHKQNCCEEDRQKLNERVVLLTEERDTLRLYKDTLKQELGTLSQERDTLKQERDTLRLCCDTVNQERNNLNELYATLLKERDNLNESYATLLKERDNLNESNGTLQKERDNLNELYATLLKERDNLNESYATLLKERDNLNESNGILLKERDNLNELYATLLKERDNLNESNGTLQKERDNLNELYATLLKERDNLNESNGTLQKERDNLNELYATLLKERDNLNESNGTLQKERDNLNESNGTLLIERDNLKVAEQQHQTEISRFENMEREIWGMLDNTTEKIQALAEINADENKENRQLHVEGSLRQVNCLEMLKEILYQKDMQIEALRKEREVIRKSERATKSTLHMLTKECDAKEARLSQEIGSLNYNLKQAKQLVHQQQLSQDTETQLKIDASQALEAAKRELQEVREQMLKIETEHAHDKQQFELMAQQFQAQHAQILQEKADLQADLQKHTVQLLMFQEMVQGHKGIILKQQDDFRTLEKDLLHKQKCLEEGRQKLYERMLMLKEERNTLTQERDTLKQELDTLNQEHEAFRKERCTLKLYNDTLKQDLISVEKQLKEEVSRQEIETEARAMTEKQLSLVQHQLEQSEQKYARLKIEMTDQQTTSDERQIQLSKQLNDAKKELAETMQRLSATYTAAAEEEGLPDRTTLQRDCQVLQAKYQEAKTKIDELHVNLKDQRNEMEGKLEKMKNKMNNKYEEHTRKLSNQIVRLNERILEQQKQHAITTTKLRHMQATSEATKSSSSLSTLTVAGSATTAATGTGTGTGTGTAASATEDWQPFKRPSAPSSNLAMEDEEGEVFNNTYLTDLKLGRVPDITAEELNYRNSLQPPHLRSTYAAQYDVGSQDEDLKDGPHSLDDSMSALLSSSASTGARKKSMGTHYKRPGPPTPSKNGGRLSFGSSEPPREILRETCENTGTSKTPTRFKMFTSRFSIGSTTSGSSGLPRDERPLRRERPNLLTGMQRRRLQLRQSSGLFCTSTPRKSRSYYDQRRLICASDAISDQEEDEEEEEVEQEGNEQEPEQEQENVAEELEEEGTPHLSNAALLAITRGVTRRLSNDPRYSSPSSGSTPQFAGGKRKYRKGRVSLCLHGNIFARSRPLTKNTAAAHAGNLKQQREKLKQQRLNRFDQGRHFNESPVPAVTFQQSPIADNLLRHHQAPTNVTYKLLQPLDRCANNNYSQHNRNKEQQQQQQQQQDQQLLLMMGQTVVLRPEEQILDDGLLPVAATTFNVSETDSTDMWQHRQGFEGENIQAWLTEYARERETPIEMENEDSHGGHFERLCRETESTAPFELQPLHYKEQEEQPKVRSVLRLNITGTTSVCTTNASCATNLTSASSQKSCTIYSLGNIQSEPLPKMTITHVEQRLVHHERRTKALTLRELWYTFCRLNLPGRLMLSLALALTMMLCSQVADRMAVGVTAAFGLLLLVLSLSCGK
ncbi:GL14926 [Drosophila persimilis]|uniref:GL14926 n=1 Tax=Drosophila persimilis TaxID=7234 RepID=B4H055_DROPE|nr:GL14926 [Drosophila persimilis]